MRYVVRLAILGVGVWLLMAGPARAGLVINELMYNSRETPDIEYIELYNTGPVAVNMAGWYLLDDTLTHDKCYLVGTLEVGQYWVVPGLTSSFVTKYPWVSNLNPNQFSSADGLTGWNLGNSNDDVRLYDPAGLLNDYVHYTDQPPWPTAPDGLGPSLELYNPGLDNGLPVSWGASTNTSYDGTPGEVNSVYRVDQAPLIEATSRSVLLPTATDTVTVTARVTDDQSLTMVDLYVNTGSGYVPQPMFDDGMHGDGGINDSIYGASILPKPNGTIVRYYISATDSLPQSTLDPRTAPAEYYGYTVGYTAYQLVINEILARNVLGIVDEAGQHEDWLEIKNREAFAINLGGMYLSDNPLQPRKWRIPDATVIPAGQYLYFWCDSDVNQGPLHASFKLNAGGGQVGIYDTMDHGNVPVNVMTYGISGADVAFGYRPEDSDAPEFLTGPTPGASNATSTLFSPICINEFLTSSAAGGIDDWVELYNRGTTAVDISGWHISDSGKICVTPANDYVIPAGTIIPAGGFWVVDEAALGFGFDINGGDLIMLTHSDCVTGQDYFDHALEYADVTHGRLPNGTANWHFFTTASQGFANSCGSGPPNLAAVTSLRFTNRVEFTWDAVPGAQDYDVIKGDLVTLRGSRGDFTSALVGCLENNSRDLRSWDAATVPAGQSYFYLAKAMSFWCDKGTWDEGVASQSGLRDAEIDAATGTCP